MKTRLGRTATAFALSAALLAVVAPAATAAGCGNCWVSPATTTITPAPAGDCHGCWPSDAPHRGWGADWPNAAGTAGGSRVAAVTNGWGADWNTGATSATAGGGETGTART
ncbi:hypothetical protein LG634_22635 [Streptomyces bambusae]|uniref:hypothetical protein n=1 Tax=Streptomyces bambusae TaxID=1550616 RepID=UPI001CFE462A|nr:hypothetical protein [Streptomyces bambusae]MCB5167614.1 hypothetical protein [Streptomyces bambusae]